MNPCYSDHLKRWQKMRDTYDGEFAIKSRTLGQNPEQCKTTANTNFNQYLRMSQGMKLDTQNGYAKFCDYVFRAMYYPFVSAIHSQSLGLIASKQADVELPTQFDYLMTNATSNSESIHKVLSMINSSQILMGRIGVMLEVNKGTTTAENTFRVVSYPAESIIDWEYTMVNGEQVASFVNLKECVQQRQGADVKPVERYRILQLDEQGSYFQWVSEKAEVDPTVLPDEAMRDYITVGGKPSKKIPFICINVERLGFDIENPFLESVADASIKTFQADAEYRNTMYFTSNSTLVLSGEPEDGMRVGAGGMITFNSTDGDAKFISAPADSLRSNAQNVDDLKVYCASLGVDLLQTNQPESGQALNIRVETKSASLKTLSETGAKGLQELIKIGADWQGVSGDVVITGNTDFKTEVATPKDLLDMMGVVTMGGMTKQDYFNYAKKNGYTNAETLQEWETQTEVETVM